MSALTRRVCLQEVPISGGSTLYPNWPVVIITFGSNALSSSVILLRDKGCTHEGTSPADMSQQVVFT